MYATVQDVKFIKRENGNIDTSMLVKPVGTYLFYPGDWITLCGNQEKRLNFKTDDYIIMVYTRKKNNPGILGCHRLERMDIIRQSEQAGEP
jgi:hypothetical protein